LLCAGGEHFDERAAGRRIPHHVHSTGFLDRGPVPHVLPAHLRLVGVASRVDREAQQVGLALGERVHQHVAQPDRGLEEIQACAHLVAHHLHVAIPADDVLDRLVERVLDVLALIEREGARAFEHRHRGGERGDREVVVGLGRPGLDQHHVPRPPLLAFHRLEQTAGLLHRGIGDVHLALHRCHVRAERGLVIRDGVADLEIAALAVLHDHAIVEDVGNPGAHAVPVGR